MSKSIKKNTVFNIIKTLSTIIFPLITFPYVSRVLLVESIGKISFGLSIVSYFSLLASLGVNVYAIRECSKCRDDRELLSKTASEIFSIDLLTTILSYILLFITLLFYKKISGYRVLILIQSLSILFSTLGTDWINTAMEDFRYITLRTIFFQILSIVLLFIFVRRPEDYIKYALITIVSSSGANIVNIFYRRKYCDISFNLNESILIHLKPILLLFVMLLAQTIFNNVDISMLGIFKGDFEVGIYSTAHKVSNIIASLVSTLLWVIMPRMTYYFSKNNFDEVNQLLSKVFNFYITFGLPCVVGAIVLSREIILIVAGNKFISSSIVLEILMIAVLFDIIGGMFLGNSILLPSGREKYFMIVCIICAIVNCILNYFLIPLHGAHAAAFTTVICRVVMFFLLLLKIDKKIYVENIPRTLFDAIFGCVFIVLICNIFKNVNSTIVRTVLSVFLSSLLYLLFLIFRKNQLVISFLNSVKKRIVRL